MIKLVYGTILVAYLAVTARWVFSRSSGFYEKVVLAMLFRIIELIFKIVAQITNDSVFNLFADLFFGFFCLFFFDVLVVSVGRTLTAKKLFYRRLFMFFPFLISRVLTSLDSENFSTLLIVSEGVIFLYLVKKTLDLISQIMEQLNFNEDLQDQKDFFIIFLMLLYLYFIEDLVKICLDSLLARFSSSLNDRFSLVLIFIDEIFKVIILSIFLNHLQQARPLIFHQNIFFFQASLEPSALENPSIPSLFISNSSVLLLTPFPF